jgi:hypothetical protein
MSKYTSDYEQNYFRGLEQHVREVEHSHKVPLGTEAAIFFGERDLLIHLSLYAAR